MEHKDLVVHEIKTLSNLIKRRIDNSNVFTEAHKLTGMHGWIIGYLNDHSNNGPIFQKDLEAEFTIRRSTATGILQLMEKNDLLLREPVDYDARLKKLVLTPKAIEMHERIVNEIMQLEAQLATFGINKKLSLIFLAIIPFLGGGLYFEQL